MEQSKKGECLIGEQETDPVALLEDPYAIAWKLQKKDKLVPVVVGHIPREISRFLWYSPVLASTRRACQASKKSHLHVYMQDMFFQRSYGAHKPQILFQGFRFHNHDVATFAATFWSADNT